MLYYIEKTNRHGQKELIEILTESDGEAIGRIIASDVCPEDCGILWSNRLKNIAERSKQTTKPNTTKYDFTLEKPQI